MTFRGKRWHREGNYYFLKKENGEPAQIWVLQWNTGAKANFMVEVGGLKRFQQSAFTIPGKGPAARDAAITFAMNKAIELGRV